MIKLTEQDWLKLRDYNKIIAQRIQKKLPADWPLETEEIEGAVYDTFIKLLNNYKDGAMSAASYCWMFGEKWTYFTLMCEYRRLKKQDTIDVLPDEDDDDDAPRAGKNPLGVKALTTDERAERELDDDLNCIMDKATPQDKRIMQLVMQGWSLEEIGQLIGISKMAVSKRLKKYSRNDERFWLGKLS